MSFDKKILGFSFITIMILASCSTEDKYKAKECIDCMPSASYNEDVVDDNNKSQATQLNIRFVKDDQNITWQKKHKDEVTLGISHSGEKAIVHTKWHNRLMIIDPTTKTLNHEKLFLHIEGDRDTIDEVSGASEQPLKKALLAHDSSSVFAMVEKYDYTASDTGVGIYSADVTGLIPEIKFASKSSDSLDYFNYPDIKDIAITHDGQKLIAGGDDKKIKIFDTTNLNNPIEINIGKKIRSLNLSFDDKYIFCGTSGLKKYIHIYDFDSRTKVSEIETSDIPLSVVQVLNENKIIVIFQGSNKVKVYDTTNINSPTLLKTLIINGKAKSIAISPDQKLFAITATGKQINFYSLDSLDSHKVFTLNETANGVIFLNESRFLVLGETGIEFFDMAIDSN
jgi:WD40 repeat protein